MKIQIEIDINASKSRIWDAITDIENSVEHIGAIEKVEILKKPDKGIIGLKWRETRTLFGKTATEVMWITEAKEPDYYKTRAESRGSVYSTKLSIEEENALCILKMEFEAKSQNFFSALLSWIAAPLMKKATEQALKQDLLDIKKSIEFI